MEGVGRCEGGDSDQESGGKGMRAASVNVVILLRILIMFFWQCLLFDTI